MKQLKSYSKENAPMEAKYISPFTDFGFKKLFGEEANKNLLINFLNNLLPINDKIINLRFKKNEQIGTNIYSRYAIYDVFCQDEKGNQFIVEMQNARQVYFKDRAVFYSTFPIRDQASKGNWGFKLNAVYCIGILGFNLEDEPSKDEEVIKDYIHTVQLKDQYNHVFYDKLTYIFIELPKFDKTEANLQNKYCYKSIKKPLSQSVEE